MNNIEKRYIEAKEVYKKFGVDVDKVIEMVESKPISIHCWQGDNVQGFINNNELSGGIQVTGNYPYKAKSISELQADLEEILKYVPGRKRINLHAIYAETNDGVKLEDLDVKNFDTWIDFAKKNNLGLDFNPTYFSHPMADTGFTLSSNDEEIRRFWIEHSKKSRMIANHFGKELNQKSNVNIWIPDGYKDFPVDRISPRENLIKSLDEIYSEKFDFINDYVEAKLFGIGQEAYTTGSYDFYLAYAVSRNKNVCIDTGHFHLSEEVFDKLPSVLLFVDRVLLHLSRPMRWDSDHVVLFDDMLNRMMQTIIRNNLLDRVDIALDYFDGSISPLFAWVIGLRNTQKALLKAALEPVDFLKKLEVNHDFTNRLAYSEEFSNLRFNDVFDYYCYKNNVPSDSSWINYLSKYEKKSKEEGR